MSHPRSEPALESGLIALKPASIGKLPESPGYFRLRSSGQRIMYVGHAGDEGLRQTVGEAAASAPVAGVSYVEYSSTTDAGGAEAAAQADIDRLKPLYNLGYGRYRNAELSLPKKGRRIRKAIHNP